MKCSLLTLSSFIDFEMDEHKHAEVDAHLVGCQRCQRGTAHLREEVARVAGLARVHIPDSSVADLFEQLGLIAVGEPLPELHVDPAAAAAAGDPARPWLSVGRGVALPWRSDRSSTSAVTKQSTAPPIAQAATPVGAVWDPSTIAALPAEFARELGADELSGEFSDNSSDHDEDGSLELNGSSTPAADGGREPSSAVPALPPPLPPPPPPLTPSSPIASSADSGTVPQSGWYPPVPAAPRPGPVIVDSPRAQQIEVPEAQDVLLEPIADLAPVPADVEIGPELAPETVSADLMPPTPPLGASESADQTPAVAPAISSEETPVTPTYMAPQADLDDLDTLSEADMGQPSTPPARARTRLGMVDRIRERIALQRTLRQGSSAVDKIEIVSGTGAPVRNGGARGAVHRARNTDRLGSSESIELTGAGPILPPPLPGVGIEPAALAHDDFHHEVSDLESVDTSFRSTPQWTQADAWQHAEGWQQAAQHQSTSYDRVDEPAADTVADDMLESRRYISDDAPPLHDLREQAIRHHKLDRPVASRMPRRNILAGVTTTLAPRFAALRSFAADVLARVRINVPVAVVAAFALVLMIIGIASGRHVSSLATTTAVNQSSAATTHSSAPTAAAAQPPAAAAPAQSPAALQITNPTTIGGSGTGYQLANIRYGVHPGDFRMVIDLNGGSGVPKAVIGMTDPTTLVVAFSGVTSSGNLGQLPNTTVVTAVKQLSSTASGETVIQFTLAHPVTVTQGYVTGPLRLVLDLH